ncbi:MAG: hypothetical protein M3O50_14575 [Myxococcota bacterium]|nr:hypothetical protein [Myxococcota bacterium]
MSVPTPTFTLALSFLPGGLLAPLATLARRASLGTCLATRSAASLAAAALLSFSVLCNACSGTRPSHTQVVAPAPPPRDDGKPAEGGEGGQQHAAALEQLKVAKLDWRDDPQRTLRLPLPDAEHWTRVKFWGVKSLVGFRYGKDHHAIVGAFVVHVPDEAAPGVCSKSFEDWAQPWVESFEVAIAHEPPKAVPWTGKIVDIDALVATTATLGMHEQYAVVYATYPAWKGACLVVGIAIPSRDELERAKAVRDRFATEVLPAVMTTSKDEPKEAY